MIETDGRRLKGDASRRLVLEHAVDLASVDGLDGLSIGRLADAAHVSKSGVATLFGTKERLQLAAVEAARLRFVATVIEPARVEPRGIRRIVALLDGWIAYSRSRVFAGGCFFAATTTEFDAKPGAVRDALAAALAEWNGYIAASFGYAVAQGEVGADEDPEQFAFEATALLDAANTRSLLGGSNQPYVFARRALVTRLRSAGADDAQLARLTDVDDLAA
ncbi:TetR/AcrR family transcriptional regulator [Agromyces cerinus]|uniref:Transcriptional regulator, TetR family n=1 Tax=Agromyces cerinus subsp. cerinus TaxID=232089 RepID=A0A1N6FZ94_9MICO|nr:TetR/AcrR family transcriptional regulator [Agromyces cerinus]SIO00619.1 transcriptional regulator, TetR family [Agromyces cerinus subsp. cerinus]